MRRDWQWMQKAEAAINGALAALGASTAEWRGNGSRYLTVEVPGSDGASIEIRLSDHRPPTGRGGMFTDAYGNLGCHCEADLTFSPGGVKLSQARKAIAAAFERALADHADQMKAIEQWRLDWENGGRERAQVERLARLRLAIDEAAADIEKFTAKLAGEERPHKIEYFRVEAARAARRLNALRDCL